MKESMTAGGCCVHGVPYGPGWTCGMCSVGSIQATNVVPPFSRPALNFEDIDEIKRDLRRIIELLERIAGIRR